MIKVENKYGSINITAESIAKLAGSVALDCYGIVGMSAISIKDGIFKLLKKENIQKGIDVRFENNKIFLTMHIFVEYGTNIPAITESVIEIVKYKVEEYSGIEVERVDIVVSGVRITRQ